jgi:GTP-binding protein
MVIDGADAMTKHEEIWIRELRSRRVPMIIAVNKQDGAGKRRALQDKTYRGIPMIAISAVNGGGVGDLLSAVVKRLTSRQATSKKAVFSLGIIGRTNVGKSALFNAILNDDRAIVSPLHHTTRESMKAIVEFEHVPVEIIDTAGAQKRAQSAIFEASQKLTMHTIKTSDVLALVVQAGEVPVPSQDIKLAHTILEERKSLIIVNNKWDTIGDRSPQTRRLEETRIRKAFRGLDFIPIVMTSATTRHRIMDVLAEAGNVYRERFIELQPEDLATVARTCRKHIRSLIQTGINPPTFSAVYHQSSVPEAIAPIVIKAIRDQYPFAGTPIIISVNKSPRNHGNASRHRTR